MERQIKFRVYDKDYKKMRYLDTSHDFIGFDNDGNGYYHNMQTGLGEWFGELMQYTGLKDKYGTEIYEGDILRDYGNDIEDWIVSYEDGAFVGTFDNVCENLFELTDLEVVGNIIEWKEFYTDDSKKSN